MLILEIAAGSDRGEQLRFDDDAAHTLGRFSLQHVWPDPKISRQHARLQRTPRGWVVTDLQSRNGTYVNGSLIHKSTVLHDHDRLRLGRTYFAVTVTDTFMFDSPPPEAPETPEAAETPARSSAEDADEFVDEQMQGTAAGDALQLPGVGPEAQEAPEQQAKQEPGDEDEDLWRPPIDFDSEAASAASVLDAAIEPQVEPEAQPQTKPEPPARVEREAELEPAASVEPAGPGEIVSGPAFDLDGVVASEAIDVPELADITGPTGFWETFESEFTQPVEAASPVDITAMPEDPVEVAEATEAQTPPQAQTRADVSESGLPELEDLAASLAMTDEAEDPGLVEFDAQAAPAEIADAVAPQAPASELPEAIEDLDDDEPGPLEPITFETDAPAVDNAPAALDEPQALEESDSLATTLSMVFREGSAQVKPPTPRPGPTPRRWRRYATPAVMVLLVVAGAFFAWQWYRSVESKERLLQQMAGASPNRSRADQAAAPARPTYVPGSRSPVQEIARRTDLLRDPDAGLNTSNPTPDSATASAPENAAAAATNASLTPEAIDTAQALASLRSRTQEQPVQPRPATVLAPPTADGIADELTLAKPVLDWLGPATMSVPELAHREAPAPQDFEAIRAQRQAPHSRTRPGSEAAPQSSPDATPPAAPASAAPEPASSAQPLDVAPRGDEPNHGIRALQQAQQVVFVVDASGSLLDTLPLVKREVHRMVGELRSPQRFTVLFFQDDRVIEPPPAGLKAATDRNKAGVADWMNTPGNVTPAGRSRPVAALQAAFACDPDQVYLITDSLRDAGDETLAAVQALNAAREKPVRINTVQFLDDHSRDVLQGIARQTGGAFRFVSEDDIARQRSAPVPATTGDPLNDSLLMILDGGAPVR